MKENDVMVRLHSCPCQAHRPLGVLKAALDHPAESCLCARAHACVGLVSLTRFFLLLSACPCQGW